MWFIGGILARQIVRAARWYDLISMPVIVFLMVFKSF
jgi:hypothetical protein